MNQTNKIIPAATILMLRDGPSGLEVCMVVRHHQIDFASGAFSSREVKSLSVTIRPGNIARGQALMMQKWLFR